jgi:hypothetical protein
MFKPGGEVTITMIVARNVELIGRIARLMVNGKTIEGMGRVPSEATKQE